jgi:hypothetical protein
LFSPGEKAEKKRLSRWIGRNGGFIINETTKMRKIK